MLKNRERLYQAYHAILSMALTWALTLVINQYFILRIPLVLTGIISLIPALIVYLFDLFKKNILSYILVACVLPLLAIIFWILKLNPKDFLKDYIHWFTVYNGSKELFQAAYSSITLIGVALLGAVLFYIITRKQAAKLVLAVIILASILVLCINRIDVNKAVVGICIFYILTIIVELFGIIYSRKEGHQDKKEGILYLAPICLLLTILSVSLPSKAEPIQWTVIKDAYKNISEQISLWQTDLNYYFGHSSSEFSISRTGYSEDSGKLNNKKIALDDRIALKLIGLNKGESIYLTGSISDEYTGTSWEKSHEDYLMSEKDYLLDYEELFLAISRQKPEVLDNNRFVIGRSIKITYNNIKTKTFFYPLKTSYYNISSSYKKIAEEAAQITFKKAKGKGTSYRSQFFDINLEGVAFEDMLREADSFAYDNTPQIDTEMVNKLQSGPFYPDNVDALTDIQGIYRKLGERAKLIEDRDTKLPDELPARVKTLANNITSGYDTDYDKLKAIEAFLVKYKYTLSPKKIPEGEDFVDYFLFESKEGYCTSFATAMAVLGRCVGIPTRYVEGFVAKSNQSDAYITDVRNSQAHAWAEAYIRGVGWIPFEATAPYYDTRYIKWPEINKNKAGDAAKVDPFAYIPKIQPENQTGLQLEQQLDLHKKGSNWANAGYIILAIIISLLLTIILYYFVLKYRYSRTYRKSDNGNRMYLIFLRILRLLKREGFTLEQQETILMLAERVKGYVHFNRVTFHEVADIFMRYRYAEKEITNEQLDMVLSFHIGLEGRQRESTNRVLLWWEEFVFLIQTDRQLKSRSNNT